MGQVDFLTDRGWSGEFLGTSCGLPSVCKSFDCRSCTFAFEVCCEVKNEGFGGGGSRPYSWRTPGYP